MTKRYKVYGRPILNNIGNEFEVIGVYEARSKREAVNKALDDFGNIDRFEKTGLFAELEMMMTHAHKEVLEVFRTTNNGKLMNANLTDEQRKLLPELRAQKWIRRSTFMTHHDSHSLTEQGMEKFWY